MSKWRSFDSSLKNIGGSISVNGDLRFTSTGDAGGHALLNLSTGGLRTKDISLASISANSIQFSDKNDVLINSGFVQTSGSYLHASNGRQSAQEFAIFELAL